MRQLLPSSPREVECGVINLGDVTSDGTHWTCYAKQYTQALYFDSYGDAKPPLELERYLGVENVWYNSDRIQEFDDPPICGHLCLEVLRRHSKGEDWNNIVRILRNDKYGFLSWFSC